jgi:hypothetical protein
VLNPSSNSLPILEVVKGASSSDGYYFKVKNINYVCGFSKFLVAFCSAIKINFLFASMKFLTNS